MKRRSVRISRLAFALVIALATSPAMAQSTSAGVGGTVISSGGSPVAGAEVLITHVESGTVSRASTDASGRYTARGLRVGGPYTVTITKPGEGTRTEEGVYLTLNQVNTVDATLGGDVTSLGSVTVTASALTMFSSDNKGVGTSVAGRELQIMPQTNRSLDDVARLDPRIQVTDQGSGAISVAGVNNRFNTISVDGMSQGDPFGLNANGMPYVGSPISVDTIAAYDIKVSDYDVASDSVGATVNAVTKSGTNEFHGSAYYVYKNADSLTGKLDGKKYTGYGTDSTLGVTFGGPILKDRLFFFGSYEQQKVTDFGGSTNGDGLSNGDVSQQELDAAIAAATQHGMQPGTYGVSGSNLETTRYLGKLDWNINDYHRASLTYQQTEEARPVPYDNYSDNVVLSSHWYNVNNMTRNTSLQLFSDWTENFSTEAKLSYQTFDQENGNPINQPEVEIKTAEGGSIFIGEDNNRHENRISTKKITASIFGTYYAGNHTIKGGFDYLRNNVYNLYGRDLNGTYVFNSVEDFVNGNYDSYALSAPAPGYTVDEMAAALVYTQISPFLQDTWMVNDQFSMTYGLRVNIPSANKAPPRNPAFEEAFGYPNDYKLTASNKVILPRFAFNYTFDTPRYSQLRGGVGSFQSVPPYVWMANPYSSNGVSGISYYVTDPSEAPFSGDASHQNVPSGGSPSNRIDTIDPDFKLPTVWKASLGYDAELPWYGIVGTVELQYIKNRDGIYYQAINIGELQGTLSDGRESYWCGLNGSTSSANKNCGRNPDFSYQSTKLGNTDKGASQAITFALNKPMSNGWYGSLSYTYTRATEVGSDGSSQAWSSYQYVSRLNPNEEITTTATREVPNSIKASLGWEHAFFGDYKTSVTAYYHGHDGAPYTWIMNGDVNGDGIYQDPAYIPLMNDPNVSYGNATPQQIQAFQAFISSNPYLEGHRGGIAGRNADKLPWVNQLDLGIQQELPSFFKEHKAVLRLDVYNVLNLLNDNWGVTEYSGGYDTRYLAGLASINADGTYVYNLGSANNPSWQSLNIYDANSSYPSRTVSRWSAQLTFRYQF